MTANEVIGAVLVIAGIVIAYFIGRSDGCRQGFMEGYECGSAAPTADEDDTKCD